MNLLVVCPAIPSPGGKGYQILSYYRILGLAQRHSVVLITYGNLQRDRDAVLHLQGFGIVVHVIRHSMFTAFVEIVKRFFESPRVPVQCLYFSGERFRRTVSMVIRELHIEAVYVVTIRMMENLIEQEAAIYLDFVDSFGMNFQRRADRATAPWKCLLLSEAIRLHRYERAAAESVAFSSVVSEVDRAYIRHDRVAVVPLAVDTSSFWPNQDAAVRNRVVFSGNMAYKPNVEAVVWFVENCWQEVKSSVPDATLVIVGRSPSYRIRRMSIDTSIEVTGTVPSVSKVIQSAEVAIAPMVSGSGMQYKILEAMACGLPVVTTTIGRGDIRTNSSDGLFVSDDANGFAQTLIQLLNAKDRSEIGRRARLFVEDAHGIGAVEARFHNLSGI